MAEPLTLTEYHGPDRPDKRRMAVGELPSPSVAIRCHCLECVGWNAAEVRRCSGETQIGKCSLWDHRLGGKRGLKPGKAIRQECVTCMGGSRDEVRGCPDSRCALWPFRFGANPRTNQRARARFGAGKPRQEAMRQEKAP